VVMRGSDLSAVGLVCQPGLELIIAAAHRSLGCVEIEPQVSWLPERGAASVLDSGPVRAAREAGLPVLVHSVGAPVGGTVPPPRIHTELLAELVGELQCPWVSEHLSILRIQEGDALTSTGVLMAPPQTAAAIEVAAANIQRLSEAVGAPVIFETGVNYLRPRTGEIADGEFFRLVAETADCGILLDLHNLWCNEQNGRIRAMEVIDSLPLERVREVHVADGYRRGGHYLDAHSGVTGRAVLGLLATTLPSLTNLGAVVFEVSPDRLGRDGLTPGAVVDHLGELADMCADRGSASGPIDYRRQRPVRAATSAAVGQLRRWEQALGQLVLGAEPVSRLGTELARDDGCFVWRDIAAASRRGQLAGALPLTCRLLLLTLGEVGTLDLLRGFWASEPPAETTAEEMAGLAEHLRGAGPTIDYLDVVLDYELALHRCALRPDTDHEISFPYDPDGVLGSLARGSLPPDQEPSSHVITIRRRPSATDSHRRARSPGGTN
jgi:uncharacterized protein